MSRIDELIREMCPDGVKSLRLSELARRNSGTKITASRMRNLDSTTGDVMVFAGGKTTALISEELIPAKDIIREPSIIVKSRGHIDFTFFAGAFTHKNELWSYTVTNPLVLERFVYHFLKTQVSSLRDLAKSKSVKMPQLSLGDTDNLLVPAPPLPAQEEIVRILDTFSELEAKLEAELEAELSQRGKQLQEMRDRVYTSAPGRTSSQQSLSQLGSFTRATGMIKSDLRNTGSPAVHYGQIHTKLDVWANNTDLRVDEKLFAKLRKAEPGDAIVVTTSEDDAAVGKTISWMGTQPVAVSGESYIFRHGLDPFYLAHFFYSSSFHKQKARYLTGTKVRRISGNDLGKILIPVPPLEEQQKIGRALNSLHALSKDIGDGIPAEISARRKQYEYYRDKLLSFEELVA